MTTTKKKGTGRVSTRWALVLYDILVYLAVCLVFFVLYPTSVNSLTPEQTAIAVCEGLVCIFAMRFILNVYRQIWRYGGMQAYLRLVIADAVGGVAFILIRLLPFMPRVLFARIFSVIALNLLGALVIRIVYQYLYQTTNNTAASRFMKWLLRTFAGIDIGISGAKRSVNRIRIAIVGAGAIGVMLAEELMHNPQASYEPVCFIDTDSTKIGREIYGIRVLAETDMNVDKLAELGVQEVVFAISQISLEDKNRLYEYYKKMGYKVKVYDYPTMQSVEGGKRQLREFRIEELLFRQTIECTDEKTAAFYKGKTVLITGGGGSIGSELCRQVAKMEPKQVVIVDIYENNAYDVQQELKIAYGGRLQLEVEIASICDRREMEKIFARYRPDIVLHAAAHKHVPLMERNVCEAVRNNVFGTLNIVDASNKYGVKRFIMLSSDKAVNPTNVMGATKRLCEMLVLSQGKANGECVYSCTRFGNVLGSAGSVVPLFQRQIRNGGPITITDKRIIRYFMTIPEASQLVLQSGEMAKDGELFVLDMGKPVKILELAENMIRLMGYEPYKDIEIVETGLRPGEKLYEELLIRDESLSRTRNQMIFIERDRRLTGKEVQEKLDILDGILGNRDDEEMRKALKDVVTTYCDPDEVNENAEQAKEMQIAAN